MSLTGCMCPFICPVEHPLIACSSCRACYYTISSSENNRAFGPSGFNNSNQLARFIFHAVAADQVLLDYYLIPCLTLNR